MDLATAGNRCTTSEKLRLAKTSRPIAACRLSSPAIPFLQVVAFLAAPSRLVFDCLLLFENREGFVDGAPHPAGLGFATSGPLRGLIVISPPPAALFYGQDHLGIKFVAQDFADLV